jgi:hypothetical protein
VQQAGLPSIRAQELLRAGWGLALLSVPDVVVSRLGAATPDLRTRRVARVLGARHLLQAAVTIVAPSRWVLRWGGFADLAHASTDLALAAVDARYRRAALIDACIATSFGVRSVRAGDALHRPGTATARELIS